MDSYGSVLGLVEGLCEHGDGHPESKKSTEYHTNSSRTTASLPRTPYHAVTDSIINSHMLPFVICADLDLAC